MTRNEITTETSQDELMSMLTNCTQGRCFERAVVVMKEKKIDSMFSSLFGPEKFCLLHMQMHTGGRNHECIWDGDPDSGGKNIRAPKFLRHKIERWLTPEDHELAARASKLLRA